jgi:hypothetical protein
MMILYKVLYDRMIDRRCTRSGRKREREREREEERKTETENEPGEPGEQTFISNNLTDQVQHLHLQPPSIHPHHSQLSVFSPLLSLSLSLSLSSSPLISSHPFMTGTR